MLSRLNSLPEHEYSIFFEENSNNNNSKITLKFHIYHMAKSKIFKLMQIQTVPVKSVHTT